MLERWNNMSVWYRLDGRNRPRPQSIGRRLAELRRAHLRTPVFVNPLEFEPDPLPDFPCRPCPAGRIVSSCRTRHEIDIGSIADGCAARIGTEQRKAHDSGAFQLRFMLPKVTIYLTDRTKCPILYTWTASKHYNRQLSTSAILRTAKPS
jgi:hypothetical protein